MQPVREALPYSYQSWIVVYILQDSTGKINIFLPDLTIFLPPSALLYLSPAGRVPRPRARVTFGGSDLPAFLFDASGGPISSSSGRNGGKERRQKPMVFGIPFIRLQLRCKKVPQRIASAPTLAAADMARREQWSPSRLGDYQIAHLPPLAASVGAARWPRKL